MNADTPISFEVAYRPMDRTSAIGQPPYTSANGNGVDATHTGGVPWG